MKIWCLVTVCVFVLENNMFGKSAAIPNPDGQNVTFSTKLKTRILTNPPRRDFFDNEQQIIFPEDNPENVPDVLPRLDGPPKCADASLTFCEQFESYPYKEVQQILKQNQVPKFLFGVDEPPSGLSNRLGDDETGDKFMCDSISRTIFPKIGTNKNNKWKLIVNQNDTEGFVQAVRIEICKRADKPCIMVGEMPVGYSTTCKQKYIFRRLISLDDSGKPAQDTFKMPSACCCAYKMDFNFLWRIGKDTSPRET